MAATRADLRSSIQRKTDQGLTVSADQDTYLDAAELELIPRWYAFDPDIFAIGRQSAATDSSGILLMPSTWLELLRLEDANQNKFDNIELDQRSYSTGWYAAGFDVANDARKLQIIQNGNPLVSTTMYYYDRERILMGSSSGSKPIWPLEFRDMLAYLGAQLYFEDQGPSFYNAAEARRVMFERRLAAAKAMYERPNLTPQFAQTLNPDSNGGTQRIAGTLNYR